MSGIDIELRDSIRLQLRHLCFLILALVFTTYFRVSLLVIYPLLVLTVFIGLKWKLDRNAYYLLSLLLVCWLLSFRHGLFLKYNAVSLYFFIPFLLLILARPKPVARPGMKLLMSALTIFAVINNLIGIAQFIAFPNDDSFSGMYGRFTVSQNGLSLVNAVLFFYYFNVYLARKRTLPLLSSGFFLFSMVMGFYGAGLMAVMLTLVLTYLKIRLKNILMVILITVVVMAAVAALMQMIAPATLEYNVEIIKRFLYATGSNVPRKLIVFKNYISAYPQNFFDFLFGSGPGTFNSRSAFMVGSPTYFHLDAIKSDAQPPYFSNYAYPLWNETNTGPYDGFMNQPFTSILSLLGEYGVLFTAALLYVAIGRFRNAVKAGRRYALEGKSAIDHAMFRYCSILAFVLILIDNYLEYPEIAAFLLIVAKLSEQSMVSRSENAGAGI